MLKYSSKNIEKALIKHFLSLKDTFNHLFLDQKSEGISSRYKELS